MPSRISEAALEYVLSFENDEGYIEPQALINAGRDPGSPIHNQFTWDVDKAAQERWTEQARDLIRIVRMEITVERQIVVAPIYAVDPDRPSKSQRYIRLERAAMEEERALRILQDEIDRIASAIRRAQAVAAVLGLSARLDELLDHVMILKTAAERRKAAREKEATAKPGRKKRGRSRKRPRGERPEMRA